MRVETINELQTIRELLINIRNLEEEEEKEKKTVKIAFLISEREASLLELHQKKGESLSKTARRVMLHSVTPSEE